MKKKKNQKEIIYLIRQFYRIQEHRIAFSGQIRALKEEKMDVNPLTTYFNMLYDVEKEIGKHIKESVRDEEIWKEYLKDIKGVGEILAAGLINLVDIKKARHISSLWKFAGLDVRDGKAPRRKRGEKSTWNPLMRSLCWKIGKSFLMTKSPYRKYYDKRKKFEEAQNKKRKKADRLTKMHIHNRSCRFMVKRFLSDFWIAYRELRGLKVSLPYSVEKLGHKYKK